MCMVGLTFFCKLKIIFGLKEIRKLSLNLKSETINCMKIFVLIPVLLCVFKIGLSQKISNFNVKYVDKEISTPYRIGCDNFEPTFLKIYKEKLITAQKSIDELSSLLKNVSYSKYSRGIDVRTKVIIFYRKSKKQTTICLDSLGVIFINGKPIKKNKKLYAFINLLISD